MVKDCFGNRRIRVFLFTLTLMFWSIFAFSCEIDAANDSNSNTPKIRVSAELIIFVGSLIAFFVEALNKDSNNMHVVSGAFVIIGSILYLIAMFMDLNGIYGESVSYLIGAQYLIPGGTALFVGIDITAKVDNILNNIRGRICIFTLILAICGILTLIWYFNRGQNVLTGKQKWYESGWILIVSSSLILLIIIGLLNKSSICLLNVLFGFILFCGACIVLYFGSDMTYSQSNFSCDMRDIGYYIIVFIDAFVVTWDVQVGASADSGGYRTF